MISGWLVFWLACGWVGVAAYAIDTGIVTLVSLFWLIAGGPITAGVGLLILLYNSVNLNTVLWRRK